MTAQWQEATARSLIQRGGLSWVPGAEWRAAGKSGWQTPEAFNALQGYTTYTPGIDSYILKPFEAFFIQKSDSAAEAVPFHRE